MSRQIKIDPRTNPGLYSYGSNGLGSKSIFNERLKYNNYIFPDFLASNFIETWTSDRFYGIVNTNGNAVYPEVRRLKSLQFIKDGSQTQYALDFVADAWYDFAKRIRELADTNIIFRDSPWAKPFVVKAWTPIQDDYDRYMREEVYPVFFDGFMGFGDHNKKVRNIKSFLTQVDTFIEQTLVKAGPVTLSGLIEGSYAPPYISGLVIEISDDSYDDDFNKAYKFGDRNFSFIANLAAQYGFSIDKNIPWRLVADLRNPAMVEYMLGVPIDGIITGDNIEYECDPLVGDVELPPRAYGFSEIPGLENVVRHIAFFPYKDAEGNTQLEEGYKRYKTQVGDNWEPVFDRNKQSDTFSAMFETDYVETWSSDIDVFEQYLLYFYNFYVTARPSLLVQTLQDFNSSCEPKTASITRETITEDQFKSLYGARWKLKAFYLIRKMERKNQPAVKRRLNEIQQAMNIYNLTLQTNQSEAYPRALQVIQEDFIGPADTDPLTLDFVGDIIGS
tara:strand:- start:338 stop:1846 length:1509 start_codon:yes stop_codon:yes gene_type:complete